MQENRRELCSSDNTSVKRPDCTGREQHESESYQEHLDKRMPVRRALALAHDLAERTIWIKHDERIVGNQASEV
uniref:pyruvate formate lyase family protein n=1 Tax=Salmonella enterica TaxID=28901 RepID=UPI00398C580E